MQRLGRVVRERRRSLGLTLADVAERSGVTRGYVSMIENHKVDNPPSEKVLAKLGAALRFQPGELERAAQWERTPEAIRDRLARAEDGARAGRELAQWLRQVASKRERGTGKDLDALYRSGQLGRRVNAVLVEEGRGLRIEDRGGSGEERGSGSEDRGMGIEDRGLGEGGSHGVDARVARGKAVGLGPDADASGVGGRASDIDPRTSDFPPRSSPLDPHASADPRSSQVPLINKVAAGLPSGFTDLDYPARVGDGMVVVPGYTGLHGGDDPDAFAATVTGASMSPGYAEGDIVVFSPLADVVDGCDCFVRLEPDHETTFKRVFIDEEAGRIRLQPLNPSFESRTVDREQVAGMFRAVWRMSRL